jgi:hypothetical protein
LLLDYRARGAGVPVIDGEPLELVEGSFGSAIQRFRIPNQPVPPAAHNMARIARNGGAWQISRTNAHMRVFAGIDADDTSATYGQPIWLPITANITVPALIALFEDGNWGLPANGVFELRFFRNNRVVSAPGFLNLGADFIDDYTGVSAQVAGMTAVGITIAGEVGTNLPTNARYNIRITTSGDQTNVARNAVVTSWFPGLPAGLTATVSAVGGQGSVITIQIRGSAASSITGPMNIVIPGTAFRETNDAVTVATNPNVAFNITGGVSASELLTLTAPSGVAGVTMSSLTHDEALAGEWDLPATVAVTVSGAALTTLPIEWDITGLAADLAAIDWDDPVGRLAYSLEVVGTVTLPTGMTLYAGFDLLDPRGTDAVPAGTVFTFEREIDVARPTP